MFKIFLCNGLFPCSAVHYTNENRFLLLDLVRTGLTIPSRDTQNTVTIKCHKVLVTTPLLCAAGAPVNHAPPLWASLVPPCLTSPADFLGAAQSATSQHNLPRALSTGVTQRGEVSQALLMPGWHHEDARSCCASLQVHFKDQLYLVSRKKGSHASCLCAHALEGKMSLSPAFSLQKLQWEFFSSITSRQLWQVSFIHQDVLRSPRRNTLSPQVAEKPVLGGNNGNRGKKLPITVSLKLIISDILLSALCPFYLTKLELALRLGWDNDFF